MFQKVLEFFKGLGSYEETVEVSLVVDKDGKAMQQELLIAVVVLLVEVAGADKSMDVAEAETLIAALQAKLDVPEENVARLVEIAGAARGEQGRIDQFVNLINERFSPEQREQLLTLIWQIVFADGKEERFERRRAEDIGNRLRLSKEQAAKARKIALGTE